MKLRILVLIPLLALIALAGCSRGPARAKRGQTRERLLKVEVTEPKRKRIQRRVELAATVEAYRKVEISARVPGEVKVLDDRMDIGRPVKAGEVMLVLAVPELEADLSQKKGLLAQAEKSKALARDTWNVAVKEVAETKKEDQKFAADVEFNASRLKRISKLVKERAQDVAVEDEARKQLESARAALESNRAKAVKREAQVQMALASYELADPRIKTAEAEVKRVEALIEFATVRAPFDGVITRRAVDPGAIIRDPGTTLFTVMQMDKVRVLVDVPQRDIPLLNAREQNPNPDGKGDPVTVQIPSLSELPNYGKFEGTITRHARSLDPVTRTMRAEIELPNPDPLNRPDRIGPLRPGMYGSAAVLVEDRSNVLTVPASALIRRGEGLVEVYVVTNPEAVNGGRRGILRARPVVLGIDDGKEVEIREGLQGDELVAVRSSGVMRPNDAVIAVNERESLADR